MTTAHNPGPVGILATTIAELPNPTNLRLGHYFVSETDGRTFFVVRDITGQHVWKEVPGTGGGGITQLTGDVTAGPGSGSQAATVAKLAGTPLNATPPTPGQALVFNGVAWIPGAAAAPDLEAVLAVGNKSGPHDVLMQAGQAVDTDGAAQLSLGTGNATSIAMGRPLGGAADLQVFINQGGAAFVSNAGIQYSSTFANRAQIRLNAFGDHGGVAGVTAFKSRGATVTAKASVLAGDPIYRVTVIGVTGDNDKTPVAGYIDLSVAPAGVQPLYVASQYAVSLVPLEGPINSIQEMWKITSQGVPCLREDIHHGPNGDSVTVVAGVTALGPGGVINIPNPNIKAKTRFTLTVQDGGAVPLGSVYVAGRVAGPGGSFDIQSTNAADVGVLVYWQLWEQVTQ